MGGFGDPVYALTKHWEDLGRVFSTGDGHCLAHGRLARARSLRRGEIAFGRQTSVDEVGRFLISNNTTKGQILGHTEGPLPRGVEGRGNGKAFEVDNTGRCSSVRMEDPERSATNPVFCTGGPRMDRQRNLWE